MMIYGSGHSLGFHYNKWPLSSKHDDGRDDPLFEWKMIKDQKSELFRKKLIIMRQILESFFYTVSWIWWTKQANMLFPESATHTPLVHTPHSIPLDITKKACSKLSSMTVGCNKLR